MQYIIYLLYALSIGCVIYTLLDLLNKYLKKINQTTFTKEVEQFSYEMEKVLADNENKGDIRAKSIGYILNGIDNHIIDLNTINPDNFPNLTKKNCIDIANYAFMLWCQTQIKVTGDSTFPFPPPYPEDSI